MASETKTIILAIGGNSLIHDKFHQSVPDQYATCYETCGSIVGLVKAGHRVVVTHGNGPQVGFILRRAELAAHELHMVPLDSCGADTQGAIGYHIQRAMHTWMKDWPTKPGVATLVTQVIVDRDDPAFKKPSKPIGTFMEQALALERHQKEGWTVVEDAGRGWRRVVASPIPKEIVELDAIKTLVDHGFVVIAVGGGGIPVVRGADGTLSGADAVIDKDHASSLLAKLLKADLFIISTAVEKVCLNYGKPNQKTLDRMTVAEAKQYIQEGHFAPGSMLPKIQAVVQFLEGGGAREALITDPPNISRAVAGQTGTRVVP
jgi:carbamate kinase